MRPHLVIAIRCAPPATLGGDQGVARAPMIDAIDQRRLVARRALAYVVEAARLLTAAIDTDLVSALVFLAISRANVRRITSSQDLAEAYASAATIPPDELRQPVSAYAVARELGLPYETARRHIGKLHKAGFTQVTARGHIIPASTYAMPNIAAALHANEGLMLDLVRDLEGFGIVSGMLPPEDRADASRQMLRLSIEFFLDVLAVCSQALAIDHLDMIILIAVGLHNVGSAVVSGETAQLYAGLREVPPDETRRPVSAYLVARYLPLPQESARRRCARLVERQMLVRQSGKMIVPAALATSPSIVEAFDTIATMTLLHLSRLAAGPRQAEAVEP